ncbi:MAG: hypothetical protein PHE27_08405 [Alphaproteobacteria bacterium]|nr:hypothetical protein [Alphaproteobacteria bacterium]
MEEETSKSQNVLWWIASIATSVLCCSVLFVFFAGFISDLKLQMQVTNSHIDLIQLREEKILTELIILRKQLSRALPPEASAEPLPPGASDPAAVPGAEPEVALPGAPVPLVPSTPDQAASPPSPQGAPAPQASDAPPSPAASAPVPAPAPAPASPSVSVPVEKK